MELMLIMYMYMYQYMVVVLMEKDHLNWVLGWIMFV